MGRVHELEQEERILPCSRSNVDVASGGEATSTG